MELCAAGRYKLKEKLFTLYDHLLMEFRKMVSFDGVKVFE